MAITFDGVNDIVSHGDVTGIDGAANLTWMWWVLASASGVQSAGWSKDNTGASLYFYYSAEANHRDMRCGQGGVWEIATADDIITSSAWNHICMTYNGAAGAGAKIVIYLNAVAQSVSGSDPGATLADTGAKTLKSGVNTTNFASGTLAHSKWWNATLTLEEIKVEMNSYVPVKTSNLILWTPYDDPGAKDYSGAGFDGTITEALTGIAGPPNVAYPANVLVTPRGSRRRMLNRRGEFRRLGSMVPFFQPGV